MQQLLGLIIVFKFLNSLIQITIYPKKLLQMLVKIDTYLLSMVQLLNLISTIVNSLLLLKSHIHHLLITLNHQFLQLDQQVKLTSLLHVLVLKAT